jgi:hypothetical protein
MRYHYINFNLILALLVLALVWTVAYDTVPVSWVH